MAPTTTKEPLVVAKGMSQGARPYQEDNLDAFRLTPPGGKPDILLLALADGMGGHAGGAKASQLAVDYFRQPASSSEGAVADRLFDGLRAANEAIRDAVDAREGPAGMGCTLVGVHVDSDHVRWISVGDSLLWIWSSKAGLRRLNADHSMSPVIDRMVSQGVMSEADAADDPQRHALRSALTGDDINLIDEGELAWGDDQVLIAASDGLLTLTPERISELCAGASEDPDRLVKALLADVESIDDPGQDNTSVIVVARVGQKKSSKTAAYSGSEDLASGRQFFGRRRVVLAVTVLALAIIVAIGAALLLGEDAIGQWFSPVRHAGGKGSASLSHPAAPHATVARALRSPRVD